VSANTAAVFIRGALAALDQPVTRRLAAENAVFAGDLATARKWLADAITECGTLVAALTTADEHCQAGLNSGTPTHMEAALSEVLETIRAALAAAQEPRRRA
jgi:hypothetical protein